MRSLLFVPGDSERKLAKSLMSGADVLLLDLEDSVSISAKSAARDCASQFIRDVSRTPGAPQIFVRVNGLTTGATKVDLAAVVAAGAHGIMLPKCSSAVDLAQLSKLIRSCEADAGLEMGRVKMIAIMAETPLGVFPSGLDAAFPGLVGLTWGAEDLAASIGASAIRDPAGAYTDVFRFARSMTILKASTAEAAPIDTVFSNFRDTTGLWRECLEAVRDGFTGKLAIHPDQVPVINEAFTPSQDAIAEARALIEAFGAAEGRGVVGLNGKMYDRPHLRLAERLLARAAFMELP